jgi:phage gpG-like protein
MSDALSGVQGLNDLRLRMQRWAQHAPEATKKALMLAADVVIGTSRRDFFAKGGGQGGPLLHVRSGRLWRSIHKTVEVKGNDLKAEIGSNVAYARIHELGGGFTIRSRGQLAVGGRFATVKTAMKTRNRSKATYRLLGEHQVNMPARPYLSTALAKEKANIPRIILASLMKQWSKFGSAEVARG